MAVCPVARVLVLLLLTLRDFLSRARERVVKKPYEGNRERITLAGQQRRDEAKEECEGAARARQEAPGLIGKVVGRCNFKVMDGSV